MDRTRRLLYVICTRAQKSLALIAYTEDIGLGPHERPVLSQIRGDQRTLAWHLGPLPNVAARIAMSSGKRSRFCSQRALLPESILEALRVGKALGTTLGERFGPMFPGLLRQ